LRWLEFDVEKQEHGKTHVEDVVIAYVNVVFSFESQVLDIIVLHSIIPADSYPWGILIFRT
jgi:hypothetical protein